MSFKPRLPFNPNKSYSYKQPSQKQNEARSRNLAIFRLRAAYSIAYLSILKDNKEERIFTLGERSEIYSLIDSALKRLGAETKEEQKIRFRKQLDNMIEKKL
jgi:hypothetical protein